MASEKDLPRPGREDFLTPVRGIRGSVEEPEIFDLVWISPWLDV